ncbi:endothelin-converting enzyme homolog [Drosophila biarmipes]|uniref:endothelin-converting enzyme homolog n=1 Tax=Drosophila biarmipes TaxID=125945 RepID=UPI0007E644F4|nr:endothelin-converting enzyme homolog [Drosophila biarmipes]
MENFGIASTSLTLLLLQLVGSGRGHLLPGQPAIDLRIQAQEQLISQNNDSLYVQRLMRLSKSAEMRSYMQTSVEACDNFYDYSCGNWPQINPAIEAYPRETNLEQLLVKAYRHKQQRLMEQPADEETDEVAVLRLKELYTSCLLYRQTPEDLYRRGLQEIVAEFGRMPVLGQDWPAEEFDWQDTVARIKRKYGFDILLLFQLSGDRIYVGQPKQILPEPYRQDVANGIALHLERHLGVKPELARTTAREITDFEQMIATIMVNRRVGVMSQIHTPNPNDSFYNDIVVNITQYAETVLERGLEANETLYEHVPKYLTDLIDVINSTNSDVLANYIFHELLKNFYYERTGSPVEQCVNRVRDLFPELLDNMVFKQYGNEDILSDIEFLWQQIKLSFLGVLENSTADWLVPETREQLQEQLNATSLVINGYADVNFTQRYGDLQLQPRDYLHNLRNIFNHERFSVKLKTQTSASYDPLGNRVLLPVALLQPNFLWSRYYPRAVRYGSLGTLLAHQLAHSLEDASKWDGKSFAEYAKRKACFKEQYGRLRLNGHYLPESDLQAENIADNLAIQVAYHAYRRFLGELNPSFLGSESLPHLNLSSRRLFFLSFSQLYCNDGNDVFREKQSLLQVRTPHALRVLGALFNFKAFKRDFNCGSGSRMTTPEKCQLFAVNLD